MRLHRLHVQLVFEVRMRELRRSSTSSTQLAGFGQIASQRLLADHALQLRPGFNGLDQLFDHFHAGKVGSEDGDHVDVRGHLR